MSALESDFTLITKDDPQAALHPAWPSFMHEMRGKEYGWEALHDAWHWFRDGWDVKDKQIQASATNFWCEFW